MFWRMHSHTTIIRSKLNDLHFNANLISLTLKIRDLKSKLFDHYPTTTYIPSADNHGLNLSIDKLYIWYNICSICYYDDCARNPLFSSLQHAYASFCGMQCYCLNSMAYVWGRIGVCGFLRYIESDVAVLKQNIARVTCLFIST